MEKPVYWSNAHLKLLAQWQYYNRLIGLQQEAFSRAKDTERIKDANKVAISLKRTQEAYAHHQLVIPEKFSEERLSIFLHCPVITVYKEPRIVPFGTFYMVIDALKLIAREHRKPGVFNHIKWWPINFGNDKKKYNAWQAMIQEQLKATSIHDNVRSQIDGLMEATKKDEKQTVTD